MNGTKSETRRAENFRMALCRVHQFDILAVEDRGSTILMFEHLPPNKPHACLESAELWSLADQARVDYVARRVRYVKHYGDQPENVRFPFDGPHGMEASDPVWQGAYDDGDEGRRPRSKDGVYVSGWCHGYASAHQVDAIEAEMAFYQFAMPEGD